MRVDLVCPHCDALLGYVSLNSVKFDPIIDSGPHTHTCELEIQTIHISYRQCVINSYRHVRENF